MAILHPKDQQPHHHPRPDQPKKLSTKQEDVQDEEVNPGKILPSRARLRLLAPVDNFDPATPAESPPTGDPVDTFTTTHRLLRSAGCHQPLAFLARFNIDQIVFWLDAMTGEIAAGSDIYNPPGYLWRLLENAEIQGVKNEPQ